jgi:hypothetical protein
MIEALEDPDLDCYCGIEFAEGCTSTQEAWEKCEDPYWLLMVIQNYREHENGFITSLLADILSHTARLVDPVLQARLEEAVAAARAWAKEPSQDLLTECLRLHESFPNFDDTRTVGAADDLMAAARNLLRHENLQIQDPLEGEMGDYCMVLDDVIEALYGLFPEGGKGDPNFHLPAAPGRAHDEVLWQLEHIRAAVPICPIED